MVAGLLVVITHKNDRSFDVHERRALYPSRDGRTRGDSRSLSENSIWLRAALFPPGCIRLYRRQNKHRLLRRLCQAKKWLALGPTTEFSDRLLESAISDHRAPDRMSGLNPPYCSPESVHKRHNSGLFLILAGNVRHTRLCLVSVPER